MRIRRGAHAVRAALRSGSQWSPLNRAGTTGLRAGWVGGGMPGEGLGATAQGHHPLLTAFCFLIHIIGNKPG